MSAVDDITAQGLAALQAVVDAGEVRSAVLRSQRDALRTQISPLQAQISELNRQIIGAEGSETERARRAIRDVTALRDRGTVGRLARA
jgi:hypothetical protein